MLNPLTWSPSTRRARGQGSSGQTQPTSHHVIKRAPSTRRAECKRGLAGGSGRGREREAPARLHYKGEGRYLGGRRERETQSPGGNHESLTTPPTAGAPSHAPHAKRGLKSQRGQGRSTRSHDGPTPVDKPTRVESGENLQGRKVEEARSRSSQTRVTGAR